MTNTYQAVTGFSVLQLNERVNELIKHGYEPIGGATISGDIFIQALWKVKFRG